LTRLGNHLNESKIEVYFRASRRFHHIHIIGVCRKLSRTSSRP
jgi:hypothetical protein